jgi:hypothetical protein
MIHCALCGKVTLHPAAFIGSLPVGPKCARRAGLVDTARRPSKADCKRRKQATDTDTPDMFESAQNGP